MATTVIADERIRWLRQPDTERPPPGDMVLYWMQAAQRTRDNPALEYAVQQANDHGCPLAVTFCAVSDYPDNSARHMRFLLQGLSQVRSALERRGIAFQAFVGHPETVMSSLAHRARVVVVDRGYLPIQRSWRRSVVAAIDTPLVEVETEVVVPVDLVTDKAETAARTIRPKIHRHLERFMAELRTTPVDHPSVTGSERAVSLSRTATDLTALDVSDPDAALTALAVDADSQPVDWDGGQTRAYAALDRFIDTVLPTYDKSRNRFDVDHSSSELSPYLHFGQISPAAVARRVSDSGAPAEHVASFVDEVVVRRELAANFVLHNDDHDQYRGLPDWARETLDAHRDDSRPAIHTAGELENGETDDPIWNAVMAEIRERGWVHNQLRMYWGKQILYWTNTPEHAFRVLLDLNNKHFLDGRDPNSYANVAWCFGQHDQGFKERSVIGKVRPFTDAALRRKGDLQSWLDQRRPA